MNAETLGDVGVSLMVMCGLFVILVVPIFVGFHRISVEDREYDRIINRK